MDQGHAPIQWKHHYHGRRAPRVYPHQNYSLEITHRIAHVDPRKDLPRNDLPGPDTARLSREFFCASSAKAIPCKPIAEFGIVAVPQLPSDKRLRFGRFCRIFPLRYRIENNPHFSVPYGENRCQLEIAGRGMHPTQGRGIAYRGAGTQNATLLATEISR